MKKTGKEWIGIYIRREENQEFYLGYNMFSGLKNKSVPEIYLVPYYNFAILRN